MNFHTTKINTSNRISVT